MATGIYATIILIYWLFLTLYLLINGAKIKYLKSLLPINNGQCPPVAIIVPVRNEERGLQQALTSVCDLNYPHYTVVVINDRSTDKSASILSAFSAKYPHLKVITIESLPPGWLGKNHALYTGAMSSNEDHILFTDADIVYEKDALSKAMQYSVENDLDHLTILPGIIAHSPFLNSVLLTFVIMLTAVQRPWAARLKNSKASIGVGAFNLVKREAYLKAGTHKAIAMRPDDDLKLAALLKTSGAKADVLYGMDALKVEWYTSVKEFIKGLMKNMFSGFRYNVFLAIGGAVGTLIFFVLPLPVILAYGNTFYRTGAAAILLCQLLLYAKMPGTNGKWYYGLLSWYAGLILFFIILKSTFTTLYNRGIYWRGTFYPLADLRKNK